MVAFSLHKENYWLYADATFILVRYFFKAATVAGLQLCMVASARYLGMLTKY